ncbi:hypothetical protein HPP92_009990 [Vanilla planifolia]|uniref:Uncharacterized protein n=1 Tax=Vanilla planifolia TaxID=51239 RepID=A0A835R379_VANPL|nr:hypothetical protein HPP92_009990 [Vanilla planifolia]
MEGEAEGWDEKKTGEWMFVDERFGGIRTRREFETGGKIKCWAVNGSASWFVFPPLRAGHENWNFCVKGKREPIHGGWSHEIDHSFTTRVMDQRCISSLENIFVRRHEDSRSFVAPRFATGGGSAKYLIFQMFFVLIFK